MARTLNEGSNGDGDSSSWGSVRAPALLSDVAAAHVARLIEDGTYRPGDRLPTERDLADDLGVSRTAIREAFRALQALGLVEAHVGRGRFVTQGADEKRSHYLAGQLFELHTNELTDLSTVRELLESAAIRSVSPTDCPEIALRMTQLLKQASIALQAGRFAEIAQIDGQFHSVPLEFCSNRALRILASGVLVAMGGATRSVLSDNGRVEASLREHERILDAFRSADVEFAAVVTGHHQNSARHRQMVAEVERTA